MERFEQWLGEVEGSAEKMMNLYLHNKNKN